MSGNSDVFRGQVCPKKPNFLNRRSRPTAKSDSGKTADFLVQNHPKSPYGFLPPSDYPKTIGSSTLYKPFDSPSNSFALIYQHTHILTDSFAKPSSFLDFGHLAFLAFPDKTRSSANFA